MSHVEDGSYAERYSIGDTKLMEFGDYKCHMRIAAFDLDPLASGEGNAAITWVANDIPMKHRLNSSNTTDGGWKNFEMRSWLIETILPMIPEVIRSKIKDVTKPFYIYKDDREDSITDKIWIPSVQELNGIAYSTTIHTGDTSYPWTYFYPETTGVRYDKLFKYRSYSGVDVYRIRSFENKRTSYWSRTTAATSSNENNAVYLSSDGGMSYTQYLTDEHGVIIGFCT